MLNSKYIMKTLYPKIKFIYSLPYDCMLTKYENKNFQERQIKEIQIYIRKLQAKWNKISKPVYQALRKLSQSDWQEKEIKCYVVKNCKYSGISHPLTIRMEKDFNLILDTLIHELIHILVTFDIKKYKKIEKELKNIFPQENQRATLHIYINFIEYQILKKVFSKKIVDKVIKRNLKLTRIKRAWEIVLSKENELKNYLMNSREA